MEATTIRQMYRRCVEIVARVHGRVPQALVDAVGAGSLVIARQMLDGYLERQGLPKTAASWAKLEKTAAFSNDAPPGSMDDEYNAKGPEHSDRPKNHEFVQGVDPAKFPMLAQNIDNGDVHVINGGYYVYIGNAGGGDNARVERALYEHWGTENTAKRLAARLVTGVGLDREEATAAARFLGYVGRRSAGTKTDVLSTIATFLNAINRLMSSPDAKGSIPSFIVDRLKGSVGELTQLHGEIGTLQDMQQSGPMQRLQKREAIAVPSRKMAGWYHDVRPTGDLPERAAEKHILDTITPMFHALKLEPDVISRLLSEISYAVHNAVEHRMAHEDANQEARRNLPTEARKREAIVRHEGSKWILYSHEGKVLGRHDSKEDAVAQEQAIKANGG